MKVAYLGNDKDVITHINYLRSKKFLNVVFLIYPYIDTENDFFNNHIFIFDVDDLGEESLNLARNISKFDRDKLVILIDTNSCFVLEGYRHNVYRYYKKRIFIENIKEIMEELKGEACKRFHEHYLILEYKGTLHKLKFKDILYCISYDNYTFIETLNGMYKFRIVFKSIKNKFIKSVFVEVNRGVIVNSDFVNKVDKKQKIIYLENGKYIHASRAGIYKMTSLL
ncbi:MAG: LytTR family transcriptional regulator [Erysipelotrichaceae bacterium]|nr:LytTR family transcriptional regulator [Erysipelotrichaceae bacterium]